MLNNLQLQYDYTSNGKSKIVIFLPSVRTRDIFPYYPRISLKDKIKDADTLFLSDPFQNDIDYQSFGGSWYINKEGISELPRIANVLKQWLDHSNYEDVIFYGSSMGGYCSLILAAKIPGSIAIAECPQIFLDKHPGSSEILRTFCKNSIDKIPSVIDCIKEAKNSQFYITLNLSDPHCVDHVYPFMDLINKLDDLNEISFFFSFYKIANYKSGHTALNVEDSLPLIKTAFFKSKGIEPKINLN